MTVDWVSVGLAAAYCALLAAQARQLVDALFQRHKKLTYRNGIIAIMASASVLRVIFWTKAAFPTTAPVTFFMICFYLPIWLNFAALSVLSLFYANTIYKNRHGRWPVRICVLLNVIFLALNLTIACLIKEVATHHGKVYSLYVTYAVFLDGLTALVVGYFGYKFVALHYEQHAQFLLPRSVETFSVVNWVLVLCYLARSVFVAVLSSGRLVHERAVKVEFNGPHKHTSMTLFLFFALTEVLPHLCILYLLWRSSSPASRPVPRGDAYFSSMLLRYSDPDVFAAVRQSSVEDSVIKVFYDEDLEGSIIHSPLLSAAHYDGADSSVDSED